VKLHSYQHNGQFVAAGKNLTGVHSLWRTVPSPLSCFGYALHPPVSSSAWVSSGMTNNPCVWIGAWCQHQSLISNFYSGNVLQVNQSHTMADTSQHAMNNISVLNMLRKELARWAKW